MKEQAKMYSIQSALMSVKRGITLQRAAINATPTHSVPPIVHDVLHSPGYPLDAGTRSFMEPRFGHDFSGVRVHSDEDAAESARSVNALAYTVGHDIVFGTGQYTPGSMAGKRLLAHELTHVVQQRGRERYVDRALSISNPTEAAEREAGDVASTVAEGNQLVISRRSSTQIQRSLMGEQDPIHRPIIDQYRKEHSLPQKGVDESGNRVGPSDAEIKYGTPDRQVQLQLPAPPSQQLSKEEILAMVKEIGKEIRQLVKQLSPLPQTVGTSGTQQAQKSGGTQPEQSVKQAQPSSPAQSHRVLEPLPKEPIQFGGDASIDSSVNFQLSFVARHLDAKRFSLFSKVPIDLLHEPTMTMSASFSPLTFGTLGAQVSATLLNIHFQQHGTDFIELGLGQLGLGFDSNGNVIGSAGVQAEIHSPSPLFSIFINTGGTLKHVKDGKWSADWTPISFGILVHWANP